MRRVALTVAVALLLVTAGCGYSDADPEDAADVPGAVANGSAPPDPEEDTLGWENGVWYNESLSLTVEDGLNETELDAVVDRSMARVERIRGLEFQTTPEVDVVTRAEFRNQTPFVFGEDPIDQQVYEGLFLIGEDTTVAAVRERLYGGGVAGYYAAGRIVVVTDDAGGVEVRADTLAHELTHALQDQRLPFQAGGRRADLDGRNARTALVEGEANYVTDRYTERCASDWSCLPVPAADGGDDRDPDGEFGFFLTFYAPYSEGPTLVGDLVDRDDGGWAAVNDAWESPPRSTEQVIHPEKYPNETPIAVEIEDQSSSDWRVVSHDRRRSETVGEVGVFAMLWANGVVPEESLYDDTTRYNYSHPASEGWGGDRLRAYRNGDEYGYVWKTVWDSREDARQFLRAYRSVLDRYDAVALGEGRYRIVEGGFADAFRVLRDGRTVTIVNAPSVEDLPDVHDRSGARADAAAD